MFHWLTTMTEAVSAPAAGLDLTSLPLMTRGLLTTLFGLLGVFLVLALFYFAIRAMQRIGAKKDEARE